MHYFSYVGRMAFAHMLETPTSPGGLLDRVSGLERGDVLVTVSYAYYATEIMQACEIAHDIGIDIMLLTDDVRAPMAKWAREVAILPIAGPQLLPTLTPAFLATELLLAEMVARRPQAQKRIARNEARIRRFAGYWSE